MITLQTVPNSVRVRQAQLPADLQGRNPARRLLNPAHVAGGPDPRRRAPRNDRGGRVRASTQARQELAGVEAGHLRQDRSHPNNRRRPNNNQGQNQNQNRARNRNRNRNRNSNQAGRPIAPAPTRDDEDERRQLDEDLDDYFRQGDQADASLHASAARINQDPFSMDLDTA
ncbi:hypothetical protein RRF57_004901 [Xylaria bambusicola]|uniref:Uncharacterized protein n=1 Tax=Xylaria bambusicola TaxID=326684 RepID=A0AAN7UPK7_9PEZI